MEQNKSKMPPRKGAKSNISISLWLLQVVIVLFLTSMAVWLSLKPKHPGYKITNVYVRVLDKENSTRNNHVTIRNTLVIQLNLETYNPNKRIGIYYDEIKVNLYSKEAVVIGANSLPGFFLGYNDTNFQKVQVNADQQLSREEITINSTDMMRVQLETSVSYKILNWKTKHHRMNLEAYIDIGSDGRIRGGRGIKLQHMVKR